MATVKAIPEKVGSGFSSGIAPNHRKREKRLFWMSLACLPVLLVADFALGIRRNAADYVRRVEVNITENDGNQSFAGAVWRVEQVRVLGDGRDTKLTFPGQMRLVIVRLVATASEDIGEGWQQCRLTLNDDKGRRWLPLDFILSGDISRDLDPKAKPVDGCDAVSRHAPVKNTAALIEEKFVVPADVLPALSLRLSFYASRPDAIAFPLTFK